MSAWTPRRFAARFPRRLYHRTRLALPVCRDVLAVCLWVLPGYALPLFLVVRGLDLVAGPITAAQLFSGAAFFAALGVWGAVFALPVLERRGQSPDPRLALFLTVHPLLTWLLTPLPAGFGAAIYFALVLAVGCGWAVYQAVRSRHNQTTTAVAADQTQPARYLRVDASHTLDGPHWLRRHATATPADEQTTRDRDDSHGKSRSDSEGDRSASTVPPDVLPLVAAERLPTDSPALSGPRSALVSAETDATMPGYLLERRVAGPLDARSGSGSPPGEESISGRVTVTFAAHQKQQVAHIPFWPPFTATPRFDCEADGDAELRIQPFVHPYGVRLEVKRAGDCSRPALLTIAFHGELTPAAHRAAA